MFTEKQKTCLRYAIYISFWIVIVCLGFLIPVGNGGAGGGSGTGSSEQAGDGPGKGKGDTGDGIGSNKDGAGDQADGTANAPQSKEPPGAVAGTPAKKQEVKKPQPQAAAQVKPQNDAPLRVLSKEEASEDTATIFLPTKNVGGGSASGTKAGFFGLRIDGSVILLLDTSGSMASTNKDGQMSRLDLVKKEIAQLLKTKFNEARSKKMRDHFRVVSFNSQCMFIPEANRRGYKFSDVREVADAIDYVNRLSPGGGTSMFLAWKSIIPIIAREEISAVYFLSDGEPNDCSGTDLLRYLKTSVPNLKIHTISMGASSRLLKAISAQHKGLYREVY